jgi:2-oxoglutarate dehydrogenase complex dehydrogenase (E1) component-like enzyme
MRIANPTTAANYFHLLRRQQHFSFRKPLVVATPKANLRLPEAKSSLADMAKGTAFQPVLADTSVPAAGVKRVVFCSGKVYFDLMTARKERTDVAFVRLEELCPFPTDAAINSIKALYSNATGPGGRMAVNVLVATLGLIFSFFVVFGGRLCVVPGGA